MEMSGKPYHHHIGRLGWEFTGVEYVYKSCIDLAIMVMVMKSAAVYT